LHDADAFGDDLVDHASLPAGFLGTLERVENPVLQRLIALHSAPASASCNARTVHFCALTSCDIEEVAEYLLAGPRTIAQTAVMVIDSPAFLKSHVRVR